MILLIMLCSSARITPVLTDYVDVIELNRYSDEAGKLVFTQMIFWNWQPRLKAHQVVAWRMFKTEQQRPRQVNGMWVSTWDDAGQWRTVWAKSVRYTSTRYDPELEARGRLAKELRFGLNK